MGVVNRDIKLENTLLDGGKRPLLKICDFGYSKNEKDSLPKSKVGTPGYTGKQAKHLNSTPIRVPELLACLLLIQDKIHTDARYLGLDPGLMVACPRS